ncbi:outer membrane receptor protein involved in Fe transport [Flagellimonas meridianipacifica]|uniref:Outer membrane receptor protein involved in Fe transport n=1 Tax=Flagellimonas meridianipacifica TaxID=1080225 RepID=A0A2T0MJW4_9FLAO|nr:outer membrane receptor protein involved in Fe transport [Allomuricauda pacifica]
MFSQTEYTLKGHISDESNSPIPIADVLLYNSTQENLVTYTTLIDGDFSLKAPGNKTYVLEISALGYTKFSKEVSLDKDVHFSIQLEQKAQVLEEVELSVVKNPITTLNRNTKIDVQHPIFATVPEPLELFTKLPGVQIAADRQSLTVIGKGNPLIYLNRQQVDFEVLTGLSVDAIESIELIQNPSAKYEASGRAVLLVTTKRDANSGTTISFQETASWKRNYNNYISSNASYSKKGFEVRGNFGLNNLGLWESNTFQFNVPEANIFSDYLVLIPGPFNNRRQINSGLGLYFPISEQDYISFNSVLRLQTNKFSIFTDSFLEIDENQSDILTDTTNDNTRDYFTGSLNFNKSLSKNLNLFSGLQYSQYVTTLDTAIENNTNGVDFILEQLREQRYDLKSYALRVDFEQRLGEELQLDFGVNWNEAGAEAFSEFQNLNPGITDVLDFQYKEDLYASYASMTGNLSKKVNFVSGLRLEHNKVESELASESTPLIERENTRLFPKATIKMSLDSIKTLSVNYAKSVERPNFSRTNTISAFINPVLEGTGNINLQPEITNEISSTFQYKNKSITLGYFKTQNPSSFTIQFDEDAGVAILSLTNLESEKSYYANLNLPFSKGIWTSNTSISLNYNRLEDNNAIIGASKPFVYAYTDHQFKVAKDTTITVGGWGFTRRNDGIFERNSMLVANASLVKTFGQAIQFSLRFNDIFRELNFEERYTVDGVESNGTYFVDGREVALSLKYTIGGQTKGKFKNKSVDENIDRIN